MATPTTKKVCTSAVNYLNNNFGSEAKSLKKVGELYQYHVKLKENLEKQLSTAKDDVPSDLEFASSSAKAVQKDLKRIGDEKETLRHNVMDGLHEIESMLTNVSGVTDKIQHVQKYINYLQVVAKIEVLSDNIQSAIRTDAYEPAVGSFQKLKELYSTLLVSKCQNLVHFAKETMLFWHKMLKDKIAKEFDDVLKRLGWPLVATSIKAAPTHSQEVLLRMETLFIYLTQLQLPKEKAHENTSAWSGNTLLPIQLLVKPLRKRFKYHFYGSKQTNSLDKPEWYFAQVLGWVRDHLPFLERRIVPILEKTPLPNINVKNEFMCCMVELVTEKMKHDMPEIMFDEHLFSHLVDEAILFDLDLREGYGYPLSFPRSLSVLTQEDVFHKWITVEKQFAGEKMDKMLSSPSAWLSQYKNIEDVDELKVPECVETFITLLSTITERYKGLSSVPHKMKFLRLQLHLLEDFRIRLVQVMKEVSDDFLGDRFCAVTNAVHYVIEVLQDWGESTFFIQLHFEHLKHMESSTQAENKDGSLEAEFDAVSRQLQDMIFHDAVNSYNELKTQMLKKIVHCISLDVQARSQAYRKDRWITLPTQKGTSLSLSPSACEMLLTLKDHLIHIKDQLSAPLFTLTWQRLAKKLDQFLLNELILQNRFNDGGAAQLNFDMTRNLFPLFGDYTQRPESYFKLTREALILLTMKTGSALLLKETLAETKSVKEQTKTLGEMGIKCLDAVTCRTILDARILELRS